MTAAKGTFTAIKLQVRQRPWISIVWSSTSPTAPIRKVELRNTIRAGGESRVIDIDGANRVIRSIDFKYDARR